MTVDYLDLADYVAIAAEVTSLDAATVMKVANLARRGTDPTGTTPLASRPS